MVRSFLSFDCEIGIFRVDSSFRLTRTKRYLQEMNETLEHSDPVLQELSAISTMVDKEYKECKRDLVSSYILAVLIL